MGGLGSPVSPLISVTTPLFTKIGFLPLPPATIHKKVICKLLDRNPCSQRGDLDKLSSIRDQYCEIDIKRESSQKHSWTGGTTERQYQIRCDIE